MDTAKPHIEYLTHLNWTVLGLLPKQKYARVFLASATLPASCTPTANERPPLRLARAHHSHRL